MKPNYIDANTYFQELVQTFPGLKQMMEEEDPELIHFKMQRFADYTKEQILKKDSPELNKCFRFQESMIDTMNPNLINALEVSYCESLLLGECAEQMKGLQNLMPKKLKACYQDYEKWYDDFSARHGKK